MSIRRYVFYFLPILLAAILLGLPSKPQYFKAQNQAVDQQETVLISGRNVNMVSGTKLPGGDPWLQRQNEPSVAVSTRNPLHLLAGANDYRTVDIPASEGELPGKAQGAMAGDAWVGIYKSFDGGESWVTTLVPGFPQDKTTEGLASPLKQFSTAADPIVRAGTNGLFYYSGMGFNRSQAKGGGSYFLTRFIDNNNAEGGDSIKYLDTKVIDQGTSGQFIDMPRIAVDVPRDAGTISIDGQTIPRSNIYCAYTIFLGNLDQNIRSKILFRRSTDCGATWGSAIKISESQHIIQGAIIAIDPNSGAVYIAYRRFLHPSQTNSIVIVKSTDFGQTFSTPTVIANINPFDQPVTDSGGDNVSDPLGTSFRTNSYPTMAVDNSGIVYVAWAERGRGPGGAARVVMATSQGGSGWTAPALAENSQEPSHMGHQFMPYLSFVAGKLVMVWYDQRNSAGANVYGFDNWISDGVPIRQTVDIRAAQATPTPGISPSFELSVQVSRYYFTLKNNNDGTYTAEQAQFNPPNYPLFKGGTVPFHGDYVEMTPSPLFVLGANGWRFNTDPLTTLAPPVFHVVWTDNRDVRPPDIDNNYDWTNYTPPVSNQGDYGNKTSCAPLTVGMRNQNIYTSRLTSEVVMAAPGNAKSLGTTLGNDADGRQIRRAFAIYVKNSTNLTKTISLKISSWPQSGGASFLEFDTLHDLDVQIAPYSTIARTVFVWSANNYDTAKVEVFEGSTSWGVLVLNSDPTNPAPGNNLGVKEIHNPNIVNPNIVNWPSPNIVNPNIVNHNIVNPNIVNYANPNIVNPNIVNPNIVNPNIVNPNIVNPNIVNPNIVNPNIVNPNIVNPNIVNPNIVNTPEEVAGYVVKDAVCTLKNEGNTVSAYTLKTFSKEAFPIGIYLQLLVYKTHTTPSGGVDITDNNCQLKEERHQELLLNVTNPNIVNPNIVNPNIVNPNIVNSAIENASFSLAPGEEAEVCLRVMGSQALMSSALPSKKIFELQTFVSSIGFAATAHAVNTDDAKAGNYTPPAAASKVIIGTASLPDGIAGQAYDTTLKAYGGGNPNLAPPMPPSYSWSLNAGELPPGLSLGIGGLISGSISNQADTTKPYSFIVRVDDTVSGQFDTQEFNIYVQPAGGPAPLSIITTSLPSGVLGYWYGATLEAKGGVWPRTWSLAGGSLPPGLNLDPPGVISGTIQKEPLADYPKTYNFSVIVTDKTPTSTSPQSLSITVNLATGSYFTISGIVYDGNGQPLNGVVMRGSPNTPITGANGTPGFYTDKVPEFWSGTVTPFKAGNSFNPESKSYQNVGQDQLNQNYNQPVSVPTTFTLTGPSRVGAGYITDAFNVISQDANGNPVNVSTDTVFQLSSNAGSSATFFSDPGGMTAIDSVTILSGHNSAQFYYKDTLPGSPIVDAGNPDWGHKNRPIEVIAIVGQIAFTSHRDGNDEIYIMNADGSGIIRLTNNGAKDGEVSWSPAGSQIAFMSDREGSPQIYVMNADGSRERRLTTDATNQLPSWSPDGSKIAFTSTRDAGNYEIYVMNADGTNQTRLTTNLGTDYRTSWSPDGNKIAFETDRDGNFEIYAMNTNGSEPINLTNNGARDLEPSWSPDGSKIAFVSDRDGNYEIYVMNADGTNVTRLTFSSAMDSSPSWSPDSSRIVFMSERDGNQEIYVMNADGSMQTRITNNPADDSIPQWGGSKIWFTSARDGNREIYFINSDGTGETRIMGSSYDDQEPRLSPDSTKVVFVSHRDGNYEIYVINIDGTAVTRLTDNSAIDTDPSWSPDGTKIVFASQRDGGDREIYVMNADGTNPTRLTYQVGFDEAPNWSPDGTKIVFASTRAGSSYDIYTMYPDGSEQTRLTTTNDEYVPSWSPDGRKIAFRSSRDGNTEIYIMNGDGTGQTRLTFNAAFDNDEPRWSPDGRKIAFTSYRDGNSEIYVMNAADGTNVTRLTNNAALDAFFSWGAQPRIIPGYEFVSNWGSSGTSDGQFNNPLEVAVDNSGSIYVADDYNQRIQKFTTSGSFVTKWGIWGTGDGQFAYPVSVAVDGSGGFVYVADAGNNRVQKFNLSGTFLGWWGLDNMGYTGWHNPDSQKTGMSGNGDGQFNSPMGIAVDSSGNVYVVEYWNFRIQKFTSTGTFLTKWGGSEGTGDGQFKSPYGIAIDRLGRAYVADSGNHRIQKFTSGGTFLGWWGRDDLGFTGWHNPGSRGTGTSGSGDGQLYNPTRIAVDGDLNIYVTDDSNRRIQKFTASGIFITKWGSYGTGDGQFNYPSGVAVDSSGYVYVSDRYNSRIQKFRKK